MHKKTAAKQDQKKNKPLLGSHDNQPKKKGTLNEQNNEENKLLKK
jgi:hypothetical protein